MTGVQSWNNFQLALANHAQMVMRVVHLKMRDNVSIHIDVSLQSRGVGLNTQAVIN
jgi:hypothetical protein